MKVIAHRGFSAHYPENTLLAFAKAIEVGADGIETDLRLSADGEIVLFHDDNLQHITGVKAKPEDLTLTSLKNIDVGMGQSIPTLDEALGLVDGKLMLILEIKYDVSTYKTLCELTEEKIKDKLSWVEVSCFEDTVLEYMHQLNPKIRLHKLIKKASILMIENLEVKYAYVSYFDIKTTLRTIALDKGLIAKYKVILWTVDKEDLSKEIDAGLYGAMTKGL